MPTVSVTLDTKNYVQVNTAFNPIVLQSLRDTVRVVLSAAKPTLDNTVFHELAGKDAPLHFHSIDTNVWVLAMTDRSKLIASETEPYAVALHDGDGNPIGSLGGAINIHDADVHHVIINQYVHQDTAVNSTLAIASLVNDYQITLVDATGFSAGDFIHVNTTTIETTHPKITNVTGNVLTLDRRLDFAHAIGDVVDKVIVDMALAGQAGTMSAPQEYIAAPPSRSGVAHNKNTVFYDSRYSR